MNTHPVTHEDVMAYLDGELSPKAAAEMTAHLTQCRVCQDLAADLQVVSRQLSGWIVETSDGGEGIPTVIATGLTALAAGRTKNRTPFWKSRLFTFAVVAAGLIVLIPALIHTSADRVRFATSVSKRESITQADSLAEMASSATTFVAEPPEPRKFAKSAAPISDREDAPLVVRSAELRLTSRNFDSVHGDLDRILLHLGGHIAQLNITSPTGEARDLTATLRVPAPQLEAFLAELRKLGRVDSESQRGEEVTQQSIDLEARLNNARHTEERLTEILRTRTGKLSEVLEVEEKLSQVRGEIERAEAEQKSLNNRISFAAVSLQVTEDYRTPLAVTPSSSVGTRLSNAAVDGLHTAFNVFIGLVQFVLAVGPSLLFFGALLALPAYFLWKKLRH